MQLRQIRTTKRTQEAPENIGNAHPGYIDAKRRRRRKLGAGSGEAQEVVDLIEERLAVRWGRICRLGVDDGVDNFGIRRHPGPKSFLIG
jgi:hypothetical protein